VRNGTRFSAAAAAASMLLIANVASVAAQSESQAPEEGYAIGIVEQQLANPFFGALGNAAKAAAEANGLEVIMAESATAGDAASQVTAIQDMINRGVKGISLDPANAAAVVPAVQEARDAGILVVAVNTETDPADAVAATFETDNFAGGVLMGQWAKAKLGDTPARVALLDYDLTDKTSKARHDGFLSGFGLTEESPEIAGSIQTQANADSGRTAMENLLSANPDINVVYTINEPMAVGAAAAIEAAGLDHEVVVVSIDGSCSGVQAVKDGQIGATVMQFPSRMGEMAVQAIMNFVETGEEPSGIIDTGTVLITDVVVEGLSAESTDWGLENCWGGTE
jgi:fructose transport system substrate-binding protein